MATAVPVQSSALHQMPHDAVGVVGGLLFRPMERLSRIVLVVADARDFSYRGQGFGEVVKNACAEGEIFSRLRVCREPCGHRSFSMPLAVLH